MINLKKHLDLLGFKVKDRVTGFTGTVAGINFDLYGCIQAVVNPGLDKAGKLGESIWLDVGRLDVVSKTPVMDRPLFDWSPETVSGGKKGPAEKPSFMKP